MVDRVEASIVVGGTLSAADYAELCEIIAMERLSIDRDGRQFEPQNRIVGEPLTLYGEEVAWGEFETLEGWCRAHELAYVRWRGTNPSQWGAERVVFTGEGEPRSYAADDEDEVVVARETIVRLGSFEAIIAYFNAADFKVPPLMLEDDLV